VGFIQKLKFASKVSELGPTRKDFTSGGWDGNQLSIWSPEHPLNRTSAFAGTGLLADRERIENDFEGYVLGAYKADGPVFACVTARQFVFSEAEFCFKAVQDEKLFTTDALAILQKPWPGGTTSQLLARMEQDASLAGNSWWTLTNDEGKFGNAAKGGTNVRLAHLRPDWVTMVISSKSKDPRALDAYMAGVIYQPMTNGQGLGELASTPKRVLLLADEVAHYAPIPDPVARFRGMSWLTPVLKHIEADKSATTHKGSFFDNAAVPNMAIKFADETSLDDIEEFKEKFGGAHQGKWQAYKTLFLMGGADAVPLTHDFRNMDFTNVVGKGESSIASAAQVPPSWVGFSEGLQGSSLNSGNMAANRRRFADGTIRPLWREMCAALAVLIDVPKASVLWWKEDGIAFLREDQTDRAEIMRVDMNSVDAGIKAGFEPDACVHAVAKNRIEELLGKHTGLVSVQMQPPVDPDNTVEETEGQARIMQTQALTIQTFITAGFTHESSIEAAKDNDLTKLVKDPNAQEPWSPMGTALRVPGGGANAGKPVPDPTTAAPGAPPAKPPAAPKPAAVVKPPAAKPPTTPGGGK
jgi:hypothetical protein